MSSESEINEALALLRALRENQEQGLAIQREALILQRKAVEATLNQFARTEAIQNKAEHIQERSAELVAYARRMMKFVLPIIIVLLAYLTWLLFRHWF